MKYRSIETRGQPNPQRRILVVGPGGDSRGGIASVVRMHERAPVWGSMQCELLPTFADGNPWCKLKVACQAYIRAPRAIWNCDLVHIHLAGETSLLRKLPIAILTKLLRRPLIVHIHAHSPESLFDRTPRWIVSYVLHIADRVIALSRSWATVIHARMPNVAVEVIANPVGQRTLRAEEPTHNVILFVGRVEPRKGYRDLLRAAIRIRESIPDAQFWFVGDGEIEEACTYADEIGITDAVRFLGWLAEEQVSKIYDDARVFCLPSYNEGLPMVVIEAMGHGLPLVCTSVGGLPELIEDGVSGLIIAPGDLSALADSLSRLLRDKDLRRNLGRSAWKAVHERCGLQKISDQLESLYLSVLAPPPR